MATTSARKLRTEYKVGIPVVRGKEEKEEIRFRYFYPAIWTLFNRVIQSIAIYGDLPLFELCQEDKGSYDSYLLSISENIL